MISEKISSKVLVVGQDYINHSGGVGGVLENYSKYFEQFNFIATYPATKVSRKLSSFPFFLNALWKISQCLIKNREIRIVHIHGAARGSLIRKVIIFALCKLPFRREVIFHSHGGVLADFYHGSPFYLKSVFRFFFNNVDGIICLSPEWYSFFETNFKPRSLYILENIVDENTFNLNRKHSDKLILLFLGIVCEPKGIFDLLDVIVQNKEEFGGKLELKIGGKGEVDKLNEIIRLHKLEDIVFFEGWVTGEKKRKLLEESDVYVLPSYFEALPLSILEAMSYGLPAIATRVGGVPEIVKDKKNGFLITPGNKKELAESIRAFLNDKSLLSVYGEVSSFLVQPYFAKNVIPKLEKIYTGLLTK